MRGDGRSGASVTIADIDRDAAEHEAAVSAYGPLDAALNNAGIGGSGFPLHEQEEVAFGRAFTASFCGWTDRP